MPWTSAPPCWLLWPPAVWICLLRHLRPLSWLDFSMLGSQLMCMVLSLTSLAPFACMVLTLPRLTFVFNGFGVSWLPARWHIDLNSLGSTLSIRPRHAKPCAVCSQMIKRFTGLDLLVGSLLRATRRSGKTKMMLVTGSSVLGMPTASRLA